MDTAEISKAEPVSVSLTQDADKSLDDELQQLLQTLPKEEGWSGSSFYLYQGFWCSARLKAVVSFQTHFPASDSNVIVASLPKCGTTWLKTLTFSTLYRNQLARDENPLRTSTPHRLVRQLEYDVYVNNPCPNLENMCVYKPWLFATHVPYASLPTSIKDSNCKIVCICRIETPWIRSFLFGFSSASFETKTKSCFPEMKLLTSSVMESHEDLKEDISCEVKQLAMFLGVPFTEDEEKQGVVEEIATICSFENLKELEVNKKGLFIPGIPNESYFRKGKVGDWRNYFFTPSMVERLEKLIHQKLDASGLAFELSSKTSKA
ncbi:sulfotransferase 2A, ARABIDOPSIS THALIANA SULFOTRANSFERASE 2A [Hibiscus trionum]|uniref:Sulfotransferase n=1 Tax=Hibiscus trionum TaxID=183268 RepID=A0A9W7MLB6_HIBTR|nr:sulfotransferase 2A, ARABIDOPSIS THALIANA SULFOTRANSFERASE 2A [Hibiscus trionum]